MRVFVSNVTFCLVCLFFTLFCVSSARLLYVRCQTLFTAAKSCLLAVTDLFAIKWNVVCGSEGRAGRECRAGRAVAADAVG